MNVHAGVVESLLVLQQTVLEIVQRRVSIRTVELGTFRRKRLRLVVMGGFGAFLLACLVAVLILRR